MPSRLFTWPKEEAVLTLRCVNCSCLFDAYPGDEQLVIEHLCPECFVKRMYDASTWNPMFWVGVSILAVCAAAMYARFLR